MSREMIVITIHDQTVKRQLAHWRSLCAGSRKAARLAVAEDLSKSALTLDVRALFLRLV